MAKTRFLTINFTVLQALNPNYLELYFPLCPSWHLARLGSLCSPPQRSCPPEFHVYLCCFLWMEFLTHMLQTFSTPAMIFILNQQICGLSALTGAQVAITVFSHDPNLAITLANIRAEGCNFSQIYLLASWNANLYCPIPTSPNTPTPVVGQCSKGNQVILITLSLTTGLWLLGSNLSSF